MVVVIPPDRWRRCHRRGHDYPMGHPHRLYIRSLTAPNSREDVALASLGPQYPWLVSKRLAGCLAGSLTWSPLVPTSIDPSVPCSTTRDGFWHVGRDLRATLLLLFPLRPTLLSLPPLPILLLLLFSLFLWVFI